MAGSLEQLHDTATRSDADGPGPVARFRSPGGLVVDGSGNVYVADTRNHTIRRIGTDNVVSTVGGVARVSGARDGPNSTFSFPAGLGMDSAGNLYVIDGWSDQPLTANFFWTSVRRVAPDGVVSTVLLRQLPDVINGPSIAVDAAGSFWLTTGGVIRRIDPSGVSANVTAPEVARLNGSLAVDKAATVYLGYQNTIRKRVPGQAEVVLAGSASAGYADGIGSAARFDFHQPSGANGIMTVMTSMVVDSSGNLYVADTNNFVIRKVTPDGVVSTVAGQPGGKSVV